MTRVLLGKYLDMDILEPAVLGIFGRGVGRWGLVRAHRGHPMPRHPWGYSDLGRNSTCYCVAPI